MDTDVADKKTEENSAKEPDSVMEDGFVRSLAVIHKSLKKSKNLKI
ncbi:MAG: hypothetical protein P8J61_09010 [Gammaproteobacteria bacterium]|jgi:hypothetical protein|nr:hypothetical protein [Gammaproteobacteria bacterium]